MPLDAPGAIASKLSTRRSSRRNFSFFMTCSPASVSERTISLCTPRPKHLQQARKRNSEYGDLYCSYSRDFHKSGGPSAAYDVAYIYK